MTNQSQINLQNWLIRQYMTLKVLTDFKIEYNRNYDLTEVF